MTRAAFVVTFWVASARGTDLNPGITMKTRSWLVAGLVVWCVSFSAQAQTVLAENLVSGVSSTANSSVLWGQTFQPTTSGFLWNVEFLAEQNIFPIPATVSVQLYAVTSTAPLTLTPLAVASTSTAAIPGAFVPTWLKVDFSGHSVFLSQAQSFAFVMSYDTTNEQFLSFLGAPAYAGGDMIWSTDNGLSFAVHPANTDLTFRITAVPEPRTAGLLALATLGLASWQCRTSSRRTRDGRRCG